MKKDKNLISFYILVTGIGISIGYFLYVKFSNFINSSFFLALVTLLVGSTAIALYLIQKSNKKRDAAKIIIQEIRRAEDIISDYKKTKSYQFAIKIIPTNSWVKNIHLFVGDLENDELDKISNLYSTGEYLDSLVSKISEITFNHDIEVGKKMIEAQQQSLIQNQPVNIIFPGLVPTWQNRVDEVSSKIDPIYFSTIVGKLKKIAKLK
jgi:hypothetical protein